MTANGTPEVDGTNRFRSSHRFHESLVSNLDLLLAMLLSGSYDVSE